ncbi:hypothetical protein CTM62_08495 [Prevotella intermedia]|uniref:Uncharacterized protein n=1 Tax=Prevotella intermedia TaxID=28131 RepID=A0A2D3L859_PREIN|nr:hypothetical protein CTM62_08495 [Prevotella intermedia]
MTLRKRLFCNAKQPLLPCKTYAFGMQNNRFYNALIIKALHNRYTCEKYLQTYRLFPVYKNGLKNNGEQKLLRSVRHLLPIYQGCFLLVFSSKYREVNVSFRVGFQVHYQAIDIAQSAV